MKTTHIFRLLWLPVLLCIVPASADAQLIHAASGAVAGALQEDIEIETSGPVHEGFASPVVFEDESEALYADVDPPYILEEVPPLERPEGYSEWVPGYWSWDDDRRSYLWISGTWRVPPPSHVWVSGYWLKTWRGWRYVSGYWAPADYVTGEIEYLPQPPATLDTGPDGYAPVPGALWIPGNWVWYSGEYTGYVWRDGYWLIVDPNWVWVPARYSWTPYGYVYIEGHWDYPVDHCGLLFAPVYFHHHHYASSGYTYTPSFVINITLFSTALFTRPSTCHYYFGDYYSETSWNHGIYPAFSFHYSKYGYDPQFANASLRYGRNNPRWEEEQRSHFLYLREHEDERPPRTLAQQMSRPRDKVRWAPGVQSSGGGAVAVSLKDAGPQATNLKLEKVPESDKSQVVEKAREMRRARAERVKSEASAPVSDKAPEAARKMKGRGFVPGSVAQAASGEGAKVDAPKKPELPKADTTFKPDPRERIREGRPAKLREPSLDLPSDRGKRGDETGKKPDADKPVRRPGDDRPPFKKPGDDQPPVKKPGDDQPPVKKPGDNQPPVRKPEFNPPKRGGEVDKPVKRPGDDQPPVKKPGDDQPPVRKPEFNPPKRGGEVDKPVKRPGDDQPPVKKPGDDQPPARKPDFNPPKRGGEVDKPVKRPGDDQPPARKPDFNPPKRGGEVDKPVKRPGDDQPPVKKPGDQGGAPQSQPPRDPRVLPPKAAEHPKFPRPGEPAPESQPAKKEKKQ